MNPSHIAYVIAIEDPVRSPLLRTQVFNLLLTMRAKHPKLSLDVVALYPIFNVWRFRRALTELQKELGAHDLRLHVWPILFLTRHFYIPSRLLPLYTIQAFAAAVWIGLRFRPTIIHCRSYPAALVGRLVKRLFGTRMVFDTRALYPEEGATREIGGRRDRLSEASFQKWKSLEAQLLKIADRITVVSLASLARLATEYPEQRARITVTPTVTPIVPLETVISWRAASRQELVLQERTVVVYIGSWLEPALIHALNFRLRTMQPHWPWYYLLLITGPLAHHDISISSLRKAIGANDCTFLSLPSHHVARYLAAGDLAILPLQPSSGLETDPRYQAWAQGVLSVKFTEYLAAGLPVLVSRWAGAAANFTQTYNLGIVYDALSDTELSQWLVYWRTQSEDYRRRVWAFARDHFSIERIAQTYLDLYAEMLSQQPR